MQAAWAAVGGLTGSLLNGRSCHCLCEARHDEALLAILRDQLARCGPERLKLAPAAVCLAAAPCRCWVSSIGFLLVGLAIGVVVGALACLAWARGVGAGAVREAAGGVPAAPPAKRLAELPGAPPPPPPPGRAVVTPASLR